MPGLIDRIVTRLVAFHWIGLSLAGLVACIAFASSGRLSFDHSIENMFVNNDPVLASYQHFKRVFGGNEIVLAVYSDPQLFADDGSGISRVAEVSLRCQRVAGVSAVLSIDQPLLGMGVPLGSGIAKSLRALFEDYTHGSDGETVSIICMLESVETATVPRRETIERLRSIMRDLPHDLGPGVLTGEPVMVVDGFRYLQRDGSRLGLFSSILLSLTLLACFRSVRWVLIPLLIVQWTRLVTCAVMVAAGLRLSMVSSTLTAILTVIAVATVVHITVRYRDARITGLQPRESLRGALSQLAAPVFWACVTDAIAFLSLACAEVGPVRDYGVMMCVGSLTVMVAVALLVPSLVLTWRDRKPLLPTWSEQRIGKAVLRLNRWTRRNSRVVALVSICVLLASLAGIYQVEVETDFMRNFRADSPIVRSYQLVEDKLGGAGVLDIMLPAPARLDSEYIDRVGTLQQVLRREVMVVGGDGVRRPGLRKVISLADTIHVMQRLGQTESSMGRMLESAGGTIAQTRLGGVLARQASDAMVRLAMASVEAQMPEFAASLYAEDPQSPGQHYYRIMVRASERQPATAKRELIEQVSSICRQHFPPDQTGVEPQVTGLFVLLTNLIQSVIADQWLTFSLATAGIALTLVVAMRSPFLVALVLVPNLLPVLLVLGLLGGLGLRVNMGTAMVAAVSMGLSVDGSIHFITVFRRQRQLGAPLEQSIEAAQDTVGRAAVFSTIALVIGFLVLCTSEFIPTVYFGGLVSLAMTGGLLGNLVLLPLLLRLGVGNQH